MTAGGADARGGGAGGGGGGGAVCGIAPLEPGGRVVWFDLVYKSENWAAVNLFALPPVLTAADATTSKEARRSATGRPHFCLFVSAEGGGSCREVALRWTLDLVGGRWEKSGRRRWWWRWRWVVVITGVAGLQIGLRLQTTF